MSDSNEAKWRAEWESVALTPHEHDDISWGAYLSACRARHAEAEALRKKNTRLRKAENALRAEIARLRGALEPFATADADCVAVGIRPEDTYLWKPQSNTREMRGIHMGHILAARDALAGEGVMKPSIGDVYKETKERFFKELNEAWHDYWAYRIFFGEPPPNKPTIIESFEERIQRELRK